MASLRDLGEKAKKFFANVAQTLPPVAAYNAVRQVAPKVQNYFNPTSNQGNNFWSSPIGTGAAKLQQNVIRTGQKLQQFPDTTIRYKAPQPFANPMQKLTAPIRYEAQKFITSLPGEVVRSYGRTMERVPTNGLTDEISGVKRIAQNPFQFKNFQEPVVEDVLNLATGPADVGDLGRFALGALPVATVLGSLKMAKMDAKALKQFLPEIRTVSKMLGKMDEIPFLTPKQIEAAENLVSKIRGKNAVAQINKLNKNPRDYFNSLRTLLAGAEDQILNPQLNIGFTTKNIDTSKFRGATDVVQSTKGVESMPSVGKIIESRSKVLGTLPEMKVPLSKPLLSQTPQRPNIKIKQSGQALEDIIAQGRKQIGGKIDEPKVSVGQSVRDTYTQWVDRFNPIVQASQKAKGTLKLKGASLRPEYDPEYLVRRLTGAGGIADNQFKTQLEPIIKQVESAGIPKLDLDTYLANKRMVGFGKVGRDIYGVDPQKAGQIVNALETKYPDIGKFADQLYGYQNKGFQEMVDAGFISPENAKIIQGQNPDYAPLKRVMDDVNDYLGLPTRKTMQGSQPILKIKGSTRQIESPLESIIGNTFSQRAAIEKNRVAKSIIGLQEIAGDMGFTKVPKSDVNTITVWNNGQKEYWNVGKDIADVAKGVNEEQMNLVLKILQAPAALLRQGATGRNPEFMIPNIIRDQLDAGVTSRYGYIPFVDYVSGLKSMISKDNIYQKWANSGAKIDLGEMSGKKSIQGYFDTATKKKGLFSWLSGVLDTMGRYSEQPTRIGLFKKGYKKTGNDLLAMMESRDATVDFARMGSKMKVANSIIPFLNVGVQGFDKLIRAVKNDPARVAFNATVYGVLPAVATAAYNLTNHSKEYAEIPQYEKDSNFILVKGRNKNGTVDYITIPKGNVIPTIANPVQSFVDYLYGNDQQSFKEMALQTISSTFPVIGDGQSMQEIALKTVGSNIPQLFKPAAENILNKSFYKYDPKKEQTKDIVPFYLQDKQPYKQTYKFTPQMYQKIGALLNVSPLKVQNLMEGYLAGYSKIPAQIIETATKASKGEEVSPNEKTILRRFIKQTYPTSGTNKIKIKTETPSIMERLGLTTKAAEVPENLVTYMKDGKEYEVDLNKTFTLPSVDTSTALGKEALSRYKSGISSQVNKVYDAYQDGKITEKEASEYINQLSIAYDKAKKPRIKKPKKISIKISKPKRVKFSSVRNFKISKSSVPKTPVYKIKKYKVKNIKIAAGLGTQKVKAIKIKPFRNDLARGVKLA